MRVIDNGHIYELDEVDHDGTDLRDVQQIRFVRRRDGRGELLPESQREPGILTQEILRVAIDRTLYLYAEDPCDEDTEIVKHLRAALVLYESRAARRNIEKVSKPEEKEVCPKCHHMLCFGHTVQEFVDRAADELIEPSADTDGRCEHINNNGDRCTRPYGHGRVHHFPGVVE